jgi:putative peptidoglycan lipid II flippase
VLVKALSPAFFARGDTTTPLFAALKGFAVAIVLAIVLGRIYGVGGIAAAIAFGAWSNAFALIRRGAATFGFSIDAAARRRMPRIVVAALVMGGLLWFMAAFAWPLAGAHGFAQAAMLGVLTIAGVVIYGLLLALFGVVNWSDAIGSIRHSPPRDLRG